MTEFIAWCGFLGAWSLFLGPTYQASLELLDTDMDRSVLADAMRKAPQADRTSAWWWLLPPVAYVLERRYRREQRELVIAQLSREQLELVVDFSDRSAGWLLVGLGGLLLAAKETWELHEHYEWPTGAFWGLFVGLAALSVGYVAARQQRSRDMRSKQTAEST